jgi:hypothetical protein
MAKLSRSELKGIVKECLMEILSEGLGDTALDLNESPRPRKRKAATVRTSNVGSASRPAQRNEKFASAVENTVSRATNDPLMAALLADTASTTLQEQINHGEESSLRSDGDVGIPIENPELDMFAGASQNWADLAFASSKKTSTQ